MPYKQLLYVLLIASVYFAGGGASTALYPKIYKYVDAEPCIMVLGNNGIVGCDAPEHGAVAPLYRIRNSTELGDFYASPPKESKAIVLDPAIFNKATIDQLQQTGKVKGVLLLTTNNAPTDWSSSSTQFPNKEWGLHSDSTYVWNPMGDGLNSASIPFPIFVVEEEYVEAIIERADTNMLLGEGAYPRWAVEFESFMHGTKDAETCLRRGQCLPLGTKSVWSSLSPVSGDKPIIMAMANLDSNALFHNKATGAESTVSGVVAVVAAAKALSMVNRASFTSDIVFSFWSGESWGYMGSRKFVKDIQGFTCEAVAQGGYSCDHPFKTSLAFQNIKLDKISAVIELNQIGLTNGTLFLHQENDNTEDNLLDVLVDVSDATGLPTSFHKVVNSDNGLPGIPPSSFMTFLRAKSDLPGVVITDYEAEFENPYYHSQFDDGSHALINESQVCNAATLLARSLYHIFESRVYRYGVLYPKIAGSEVTGESPSSDPVKAISADCNVVAELLFCLTVGFGDCSYSQQLLPHYDLPKRASYYPSVYAYSITQQLVIMPVKFLFDYMLNITADSRGASCDLQNACTGIGEECVLGVCMKGPTYYHDAVSPGIDWDYKNSKWIVVDKSEPVWAESNWDGTSVQIFLQDSPTSEGFFLAFGLVLFIGSFVVVFFVKRYFLRNYKLL